MAALEVRQQEPKLQGSRSVWPKVGVGKGLFERKNARKGPKKKTTKLQGSWSEWSKVGAGKGTLFKCQKSPKNLQGLCSKWPKVGVGKGQE